jgi:hypothetical protein
VADTHGNFGFYTTAGLGFGVGTTFKLGTSTAVSNAPTIYDLQGPGGQASFAAGNGIVGGSIDIGGFKSNGVQYQSLGHQGAS